MMVKSLKIFVGLLITLSLATILFMQQKSFGKLPSGDILKRIEKSTHYKDGAFINIEETDIVAKDASYWSMALKYFETSVDREPLKELPHVKTDLKNLSDRPNMIWFGHSSFLISVSGKKVLADPVFSERASPVQYAGPKAYPGTMVYHESDLPDLDVIVISHDHYDHLDYHTITNLAQRTKAFVVPLGVGQHLLHWGVPKEKIYEFDWWEGGQVAPGVDITCTPARHFSGRGFTKNRTLWASFVLKIGGLTIFIGGDSGYDQSFKKIGDTFGPFDIVMLECGQYDVQWPSIHMMPEQTIQASIDLKAKVLLPVHWGKFTLALHPWRDPIRRATVEAEKRDVKMTTPLIGEPVYIGESFPAMKWWEMDSFALY
jgi:L-ascorbate metabolism protein UlaG (beta-lactamase superfamily)